MKRHIDTLALMLAATMLLSSCGNANSKSEDTATTLTTTTVAAETTSTIMETEQQPASDVLYVVREGVTAYSIVLSADSLTKPGGSGFQKNHETRKMEKLATEVNTPIVTATAELIAALAEKTGVTIPLTNDGVLPASGAGEYEILIGLTDREESITLQKQLKERTFAVQVSDKKIVIVGYDDNMTATAIRYCLEDYVLGASTVGQVIESGVFAVPASLNMVSAEEEQTPANTIHIGGEYTLTQATPIVSIDRDGNYKVLQGGATDGTYLYYCIENQSLSEHESYIYKVEIATGKIVKRSESLQLDHSNDMTYNSKLNQLVVVHNQPKTSLVSFVNVDTLEKVNTIDIGRGIFSMAYNETRDQYIVGHSGGQTFCVLDSNFEYIREYSPVPATSSTTQGMACDDNFLYFAQSGANVVVVYDWDGYQVAIIPIEFTNIETENICIVGNDIYIGFYRSGNGGIVYRTHLTVKK